MPFRSLRLPAQILRYFQKIMLAISHIWLRLFFENALILNKMSILGQAPSPSFLVIDLDICNLLKVQEVFA